VQEREERLLDTLQENEYLKRTQQDNELRIKRCERFLALWFAPTAVVIPTPSPAVLRLATSSLLYLWPNKQAAHRQLSSYLNRLKHVFFFN